MYHGTMRSGATVLFTDEALFAVVYPYRGAVAPLGVYRFDAGAIVAVAERGLLALPAATGGLAEQQDTIGDAIDARAEALSFDYGALRVDPAMRWLMAESSEIIARRWDADAMARWLAPAERIAA